MQLIYGNALHTPGCKAAARPIIADVSPKNIDTPPPRFASNNQRYSLGGKGRRLIPTKCAVLRQEDEDDADDNGEA